MRKLPPCDHDECGVTECKREALSRKSESAGSLSTPQDDFEAMADLWIARGLDHATFLMCYLNISDCIEKKENASNQSEAAEPTIDSV